MKICPLKPEELPAMWDFAFREMASWAQTYSVKGGRLQNMWQNAAMRSEEFRKFAEHAVRHIEEVSGALRICAADDAFLRGVGLGAMVGYRVRENQSPGPREATVRAKIASHTSRCKILEETNVADDALEQERLYLMEQVELLRWVLGEVPDPEPVPPCFQPKTPIVEKIAAELGLTVVDLKLLEKEHGE